MTAPSPLPTVPSPEESVPPSAIPSLRICIVAHNAYGMLAGGTSGLIGGVEWQTRLMARWLVERGHQVTVLTWDEGGPAEEHFDGIRVLKICRRTAGITGVRFFHPKWSGLVRALAAADAEVYYHNCAECVTGQVALWCRLHHRPFVYSVASDMDTDPRLPELKTLPERLLYRYGLRTAQAVIAQTHSQQQRLARHFKISAAVIPMPCPDPGHGAAGRPAAPSDRILWIGRLCEVKRPHLLLELARAMPEFQFDLVGPVLDEPYSRGVFDQARGIPNLTVHGGVAKDRVAGFYRQAACLCSTSRREGFPNTFLEAWSHGLPIVSTFDPDTLIERHNLGVFATDVAGLAAGLRRMLRSVTDYRQASANARRFFLHNHSLDTVLPRFERLFAHCRSIPFSG